VTWRELNRLWRADLYRYEGHTGTRALIKAWLTIPGLQYTVVMRGCRALTDGRGRLAHVVALLILRRYQRRWGISIPSQTEIGEGFYIGHFGGIVVNPRARIGRNCNIAQGVTVGQSNRGRRQGTPIIGDGVWIGPGAKVIGAITIGDNVVIGANCVVWEDVPANAVVAATSGVIVSESGGASGYVNFQYDG
jgi:serine O-acetyltransferase